MDVEIFIPCFIDQLYPDTGFNMVKVLEKLGCKVHYNTNQTCCGQPAFNAGYWDEARSVGEKFIKDFDREDRYIVSPSGSCTGYVKNHYPKLFNNAAEHNECRSMGKRMYEFTEFLVDVLNVTDIGASLPGKATYHDACGALRECGIKSQPRQLLEKVKGLELVEMKECETCCGFGGTFAVKFEPISIGMAQTKVDSALATGAKYLVSTDMSCLMHLEGYIKNRGADLEVMHVADVLAQGW